MDEKERRREIEAWQGSMMAEQATGCRGAGGYLDYAHAQGYTKVEVLNWCSSAGDWQFIVSKDGHEWYIMWQENNYPRGPGFTRAVGEVPYYGTAEEVVNHIAELYG